MSEIKRSFEFLARLLFDTPTLFMFSSVIRTTPSGLLRDINPCPCLAQYFDTFLTAETSEAINFLSLALRAACTGGVGGGFVRFESNTLSRTSSLTGQSFDA